MIKILLAEDQEVVGSLIKEVLEKESFDVKWAKDGESALKEFKISDPQPDVCLFDVMMPGIDGFSLAKEIRNMNSDVPIMFLTSQSEVKDLINGFNSGGDDFLRKPFSFEELMIKLKMLLRRAGKKLERIEKDKKVYALGLYEFYPDKQLLCFKDQKTSLTHRESSLLREFVEKENNMIERKDVLKKLWGDDNFFNARNMDVYIFKLRKYLSHDPGIRITNLRGIGYRLVC